MKPLTLVLWWNYRRLAKGEIGYEFSRGTGEQLTMHARVIWNDRMNSDWRLYLRLGFGVDAYPRFSLFSSSVNRSHEWKCHIIFLRVCVQRELANALPPLWLFWVPLLDKHIKKKNLCVHSIWHFMQRKQYPFLDFKQQHFSKTTYSSSNPPEWLHTFLRPHQIFRFR